MSSASPGCVSAFKPDGVVPAGLIALFNQLLTAGQWLGTMIGFAGVVLASGLSASTGNAPPWDWAMFGENLTWAMALSLAVSLAGIVTFATASHKEKQQ